MHPRCRSTISAVTEGGTRTAKVKGKSIRVPAEMSYEKWRGSLEMYRRKTTDTNYNFVSEEKYSRLIIPLQKMGVTILRGGDIEKHLDAMNAQAANFGKDVVFFREKVTVSAILEETHHVKQNRAGQNDDKDVELRTILNEIDAKEYLLRVVKKYKIPREEIEETKKQLEEYLKALEEYNRKKG